MMVKGYILLVALHLPQVQCGGNPLGEKPESNVAHEPQTYECPLCSVEAVSIAQERLASLNKEDFLCFIGTFDPTCSTNVEYSEFSNEVLFNVLLKHPQYVVEYVTDNGEAMKTEYILGRLASPISDEIPVEQCIKAVSNTEGSSTAKTRIIASLKSSLPPR